MSKLVLPKFNSMQLPHGVSFDLMPSAIARWNGALAAKDDDEDNSISIYDPIGFDPWSGSGVTAKRIAAALRSIGKKNVVVNINSPGGDLFEGIAIYNLLRDHPGEVTTRVIGLAASAASVIVMAGDKIQAARAGFMMIHNVWVMAIGNRNDLRDAADQLETFDDALASIYAARTEQEKKAIAKMMDKETWFSGEQAIESGFADELLPADVVEEKEEDEGAEASLRTVDLQLARKGIPRSERRAIINRIKESVGTPSAAEPKHRSTQDATPKATQDAGEVEAKAKHLVDSFTESFQT
jgi:ATP-dependent protease ClpP protease subunit